MVRQLERIFFRRVDEFRCRIRGWCGLRVVVGLFLRLLVDGNPGSLVELLLRLLVEFSCGLRLLRKRICAGLRSAADLIGTHGGLSFLLV